MKVKHTVSTPEHRSYQRNCVLGILLLASLGQPAGLAETITIKKGKGILWEGLPFSQNWNSPTYNAASWYHKGLIAISSSNVDCQRIDGLKNIGGYQAYQIAPGVGLVPRASGVAKYKLYSGGSAQISGTLGLPETKGVRNDGTSLRPQQMFSWCLSPTNSDVDDYYYDQNANRSVNLSGTWVLVANGNQKSAEINLPAMYAGSFSNSNRGILSAKILPSDITLRVSTLECTVNTPTSISFGKVGRDLQAGAELGTLSYPLITTCGQPTEFIDANIHLQFKSLTGLYQSDPTRLALREGGGYITGEIDNGVTGSGNCATTSGLAFDNSRLKIGHITVEQESLTINNQVTWRLCSGGKDLYIGDVSAAAEMLVTFN
ncbi:hypothetical protein [Serratia fonticola]|uniref:hypothetical protein n=1 Tax=Serratia fonticola TaxID=47917 RepID=UPI00211B92ED|nr:hypothetical protein [Serratia fonticola]